MKPFRLATAAFLVLFSRATAQESRPFVLEGSILGPDGMAAPECVVTLREARGRGRGADATAPERSLRADSNGTFRFEAEGGGYVLTAAAPGFARTRRFITLDGSTKVTITLSPGLKLTGRLVDAKSGRPIAGGHVRGSPAGSIGDGIEATTNADGTFALDGLSTDADDLRIVASARGHAPADVPVGTDERADWISIPLDPGWQAHVRLVDDHGRPVLGATVRARLPFAVPYSPLERHDFVASADASGIAAFDELVPEEPVVFEVSHDPYIPTRSVVFAPSPAGNGAAPPHAEIVLTLGRAAHVAVVDAFDGPIEDAEVRILPLVEARLGAVGHTDADQDRGSVRVGHTDASGKIAFEKLPAEMLTIEVRAPLYETRMIAVDLRGFPIADPVVRLERDPNPPAASMPWLSSVKRAFAMAEATGLAVMVSMTMDGERANDWIAAHHFKDPEVVRIAECLPCLLASAFGQGGLRAEGVDHFESDGICTRYGSIECASHQAVEPFARQELLAGAASFQVPRHVFVTADGREIAHRTYYLTERDLRWMMLRALRHSDSDAAVWISVRRLQPLWRALCGETDSAERRAAISTLAELVASGDEYALALLQGFALGEMPAAVRLQILDALILPAIADPASALRGFFQNPERIVRQRVWQLLRGAGSRLDLAAVIPYLLDETDDSVMSVALKALQVEDQTTAVLVQSSDSGDRWLLVDMLLTTLDAASIKGLDLVLDRIGSEGRNRLLRTLASLTDDDSSIRRVFGHAAAPEASAVAAIRAIATASPEIDERGRELLGQQARSQSSLVRQEAVTQIGRHRWPESKSLLDSALVDAATPVRIAAAVGLWRQGDRRGARVMIEGLDDPEFGDEIRALFEEACTEPAPADAEAWRRWLTERRLIDE